MTRGRKGRPWAGAAAPVCWLAWIFLLSWASAPCAQTHGLSVRPARAELFVEEPRNVTTVPFTVENRTGRSALLESRLLLPPGWRLITPELPFELANGQSAVRLVSFLIPETARGGDYEIKYEVQDRQQPATRDAYSIRVQVLARPRLKIQVLEAPEIAVNAQPYRVVFLVQNSGNAGVTVDFQAHSSEGNELEPRSGAFELQPGETTNVAILVKPAAIRRPQQDNLTLAVSVRGGTKKESASAAVRVVPRMGAAADAYHTIPAGVATSFVAREAGGVRKYGWQTDVSAAGTLDEEGKRSVAFRLRVPDLRGRSTLGTYDEQWFAYSDPNFAVHVGDGIYALSPLTAYGRYGRGARISHESGGWHWSAHRMSDRFGDENKSETAVSGGYDLTPGTRIDVNYLDQHGIVPSSVYSLRSRTKWTGGLDSDIEVARSDGGGEHGYAYRASASDFSNPIRYYASAWRADASYRGHFRDEAYAIAGFDYPRHGQWGLRGHYRMHSSNLDAQPTRTAPLEHEATIGTSRTFAPGTSIGIDYTHRDRSDRRPTPDFRLTHDSARVSVGRTLGTVSVHGSAELGYSEEAVKNLRFGTSLYLLSAYWQATASQSYSAYAFYDDSAYANEHQSAQTTFGLNANYQLWRSTLVGMNVQHTESATAGHDAFNVSLTHQFANQHRLSLTARRTGGLDGQTDLMLTYAAPLALPVRRKKDMSSLMGRIYDAETGKGLANAVLSLGASAAVSDENGEFSFPAVTAGTYHLAIDRSDTLAHKVPVHKLPLQVAVAANAPSRVDIPLVRPVTLSGHVAVHESTGAADAASGDDASSPAESRNASAAGAQNILVIMQNGETEFKRLTDASGSFSLGGLPPGRWTIRIADDSIPAGHDLDARQRVIDLAPGERTNLEFRLTPKLRKIKMLEVK
ncbi:MAG: hypothetical protein JWO70_5322 [Betaproteobacteria bacterium]|nr:hypothetical protein [Betaproteobacteria bacterium]